MSNEPARPTSEDEEGLAEPVVPSGEEAASELSPADPFFVSKQAAAVLKHGILSRYIVPFTMKVGSTAENKRVVYIDGYAGAGIYNDGTKGSPALILKTAVEMSDKRTLECLFIEKNKDHFERLSGLVAEHKKNGVATDALRGEVHQRLPAFLERAKSAPLLCFLDPFGLGIPFSDIVHIFETRSASQIPTEVILNFSANAIRRIGPFASKAHPTTGEQKTLARVDTACGGDWWRKVYCDAADKDKAVEQIAYGFMQRLAKAISGGGFAIQVQKKPSHKPVYYLVFITKNYVGLDVFTQAVSSAQEDWRKHVYMDGKKPSDETALITDEDLFKQQEDTLAKGWIEEIHQNITQRLAKGAFLVRNEIPAVYGEALGLARDKHVRAAVKQLHDEGVTNCDGKGAVSKFYIDRKTTP
ncbi:three-Cys-motif partner protein TcmP [Streptomyces sp. ID05-26A]|nr:three-Cys-motif partner protein TcmP [Streptomyces sp. ID05-26A]